MKQEWFWHCERRLSSPPPIKLMVASKRINDKLYFRILPALVPIGGDIGDRRKHEINVESPWMALEDLNGVTGLKAHEDHHSRIDMICSQCGAHNLEEIRSLDSGHTDCRRCGKSYAAHGWVWINELMEALR